MLVQFMVKNVLSFREETILDMTAINAYKEHESNLIDNGTKEKFLTIAVTHINNYQIFLFQFFSTLFCKYNALRRFQLYRIYIYFRGSSLRLFDRIVFSSIQMIFFNNSPSF